MTQRVTPLVQLLSTNGDGTGSTSATGDYSTPDDFYIQQAGAGAYVIERLIFSIEDTNMEATTFGALTALTTGVAIQWRDTDDASYATLTPTNIKTNADFGKLAYDLSVASYKPAGSPTTSVLLCRFTLSKFIPGGLRLENGDYLVATMNDNHTGLDSFTITAEGWIDDYV